MSTPLRVGMVSFAHSTHPERYLAALVADERVEVVGISDPDTERARPHAERHQVPLVADHLELMDRCDAVVICSEYVEHAPLVLAAVARGLHVLCEKPLGLDDETMAGMVAAVEQSTAVFMMALPCRYLAPVRRARELYLAGEIGELVGIAATNRGACPGGWFLDPARSGGGALMDHSAHIADLVRWITGNEIATVHAFAGSNLLDIDVEDSGAVTVVMSDGVHATIDTSWSRTGDLPATFDVSLRLVGTEGSLHVDALSQRIEVHAARTSWHVHGGSMDDAMVDDFVTAVLTGAPSPIGVVDGWRASQVALAAYRSLASGQPEPLDPRTGDLEPTTSPLARR